MNIPLLSELSVELSLFQILDDEDAYKKNWRLLDGCG